MDVESALCHSANYLSGACAKYCTTREFVLISLQTEAQSPCGQEHRYICLKEAQAENQIQNYSNRKIRRDGLQCGNKDCAECFIIVKKITTPQRNREFICKSY